MFKVVSVGYFIASLQNLYGKNYKKKAKVLVKRAGLRADGRKPLTTEYELLTSKHNSRSIRRASSHLIISDRNLN
jgi:hypothetical protein